MDCGDVLRGFCIVSQIFVVVDVVVVAVFRSELLRLSFRVSWGGGTAMHRAAVIRAGGASFNFGHLPRARFSTSRIITLFFFTK